MGVDLDPDSATGARRTSKLPQIDERSRPGHKPTASDASRVVCVGTNLESQFVLEGLIEQGANVVGLVTWPVLRSASVCDYADLHAICRDHGIAVVDTININDPATVEQIRALQPDYLYTLGWSQLFRDALLNVPRHYVVGSHPAPLPEGRGRAPVPWTILQNCTRSAVTLFRMDAGVDAGAILKQVWFDVPLGVYAGELYRLVATSLRKAFCELDEAHRQGTVIQAIPQDATKASHRAKRTPADGHVDFHRPAAEIETLVRAVSLPYPGAYSYYEGNRIRFWKADLEDVPAYVGIAGQILLKSHNRVLVQAGDQPLWISDFTGDDGPVDLSTFRVGRKFGYAVEDELHRLNAEIQSLKRLLADIRPPSADSQAMQRSDVT